MRVGGECEHYGITSGAADSAVSICKRGEWQRDIPLQIAFPVEDLNAVGTTITDVDQAVVRYTYAMGQFNTLVVAIALQCPLTQEVSGCIEYRNSAITTGELAVQIASDAEKLTTHTPFSTHVVFGGIDYKKQRERFAMTENTKPANDGKS